MFSMIKRYLPISILTLSALVPVACSSSPADVGDDGPPVDAALAAEIVHAMVDNIDYRSTARMLKDQEEDLLLDQVSVRYADDSKTSGNFITTVPIVDHTTGKSDRYSWLSFEQTMHKAPVVALMAIESHKEPGYQPQCLACDTPPCPICPGGGSSSSSGGTGPSCVSIVSTDTCIKSGTAAGTCVDGTQHWSYPRMTRTNYINGQKITAKDTVYSCGVTASPASANCFNLCSAAPD